MSLSNWPDWTSLHRREQLIEGLLVAIPLALFLGFGLAHVDLVPQFVGTLSGTLVAVGTVGYALFGVPVGET